MVGFVTTIFAATVGTLLGLVAGYFGGITGAIILRTMDAIMGFPMILLALIISAVLGSGIQNVIIALGFATLPGYARVINGLTISIKENDYILAERSMGSDNRRIMLRHILPNTLPPMIVLVTLQLGSIILAEAGLSFLGIGIRLIDFGLEFGRLYSDDDMRIVVADEISPDNMRLWDIRTSEKLDKDRFREDLEKVAEGYQEVARRLGILPEGGPADLKGTGTLQ